MGLESTPITMGIGTYSRHYLRDKAQELMPDRCRIYKPGERVYDPVAKKTVSGPGEIKYEGPCRLWEVPAGNVVVISDEEITVTTTYFSIPYWVQPLPETNDIIVMTESEDFDLEGRTLTIASVVRGGGLRSSRRFTVQISSSQKSEW